MFFLHFEYDIFDIMQNRYPVLITYVIQVCEFCRTRLTFI